MNVAAVLEAAEAEEKHRIELCGMETKRRRSEVVARGGFWQRGEKRKRGSVVKGIRFRSDGEVVSRERERKGVNKGNQKRNEQRVGCAGRVRLVVGERKREFGAVDRASNSKGSRRLAVRQDADARRCRRRRRGRRKRLQRSRRHRPNFTMPRLGARDLPSTASSNSALSC